ncbi:MAG: four helix bundle protein [Caldilineaceae bacterium]|nr:four helix bundle protein [Caldilineaceae bacterium]
MAVKDYRDLDVWQDGIRLATALYAVTKRFPPEERYGLASQLQRAGVSIPSNVAEGYAQRVDSIFARHLRIAIGSAAEIDTQLLIAQQLNYIDLTEMQALREQVQLLLRRLRAFYKQVYKG